MAMNEFEEELKRTQDISRLLSETLQLENYIFSAKIKKNFSDQLKEAKNKEEEIRLKTDRVSNPTVLNDLHTVSYLLAEIG